MGINIGEGEFTTEKMTVVTAEFVRESIRSRREVKGQNFGLQKLGSILWF